MRLLLQACDGTFAPRQTYLLLNSRAKYSVQATYDLEEPRLPHLLLLKEGILVDSEAHARQSLGARLQDHRDLAIHASAEYKAG